MRARALPEVGLGILLACSLVACRSSAPAGSRLTGADANDGPPDLTLEAVPTAVEGDPCAIPGGTVSPEFVVSVRNDGPGSTPGQLQLLIMTPEDFGDHLLRRLPDPSIPGSIEPGFVLTEDAMRQALTDAVRMFEEDGYVFFIWIGGSLKLPVSDSTVATLDAAVIGEMTRMYNEMVDLAQEWSELPPGDPRHLELDAQRAALWRALHVYPFRHTAPSTITVGGGLAPGELHELPNNAYSTPRVIMVDPDDEISEEDETNNATLLLASDLACG